MTDQPAPEKLAPNSPEAEEATLGGCLYDQELYFEIADYLTGADFFIVKHAWVWDAMGAVAARGDAIDSLTVIEQLRTTPNGQTGTMQLESIGGSAFITYLSNQASSNYSHAKTFARIVARAAVRRRLLAAAGEIAQVALEENEELPVVLGHADAILDNVTSRQLDNDIQPIGEVASTYYDHVETLYNQQQALLGISSGYDALDTLLAGFQKGDLNILAARPGVGKTALALFFAVAAARQGYPVLVESLEMTKDSLVNRILAATQGIDSQHIRLGRLEEHGEWERFTAGIGEVSKLPILIDAPAELRLSGLKRRIRRMKRRHGIGLVIVDYLQLMHGDGRFESRQLEVNTISTGLKSMAKEFNVPVIACCQLSRAVEARADKRPELQDLRESGGIENDADTVTFIWRPDISKPLDRPGWAFLILAKNRNGPTGSVPMRFAKEKVQFRVPGPDDVLPTERKPALLD